MNEGYADRPDARETAADTRDYPMASNRFTACQRAPKNGGWVALISIGRQDNRPVPIRQDQFAMHGKSMS